MLKDWDFSYLVERWDLYGVAENISERTAAKRSLNRLPITGIPSTCCIQAQHYITNTS